MNNQNIRLYVSFSQKDQVKKLGCKWNPDNYYWYFPKHGNIENLNKLVELKNKCVIHFVKEIVSRLDADDRPDSIRVNYKDCYNIVPYTKQDITELVETWNKPNIQPKNNLEDDDPFSD